MFNWSEFWSNFWQDFDDDPDKIKDVEGVVFQKKNGDWVMVVLAPNSHTPLVVKVDYHPWTGEELPDAAARGEAD